MNATTGTTGPAARPAGNGGGPALPGLRRQRMQAIVQDTYGGADVWRAEETGWPAIGDGEVLVRVHAAGLDRGTWHLMAGQPYLMRLAAPACAHPRTAFPGSTSPARSWQPGTL